MCRPRRRLLVALIVLACLVLAGGAVSWMLWPHPGITPDNAKRIKAGMTLAEVEEILGGPARSEGRRIAPAAAPWNEWAGAEESAVVESHVWESNRARIRVSFDRGGRAIRGRCEPPPLDPLVDRLRRRLGF